MAPSVENIESPVATGSVGSDEGPSDAELVLAARSGDRAAFARLYGRFAPMVHAVLLCRVHHADADDLTQDVFVKARERLGALRDPSSFGAWVAAMARNAASGHRRQAWRRSVLARLWTAPEPERAREDGALDGEDVLREIRKLPTAYRETLVMRLVAGMTGPQIAARTGMTHGSVRVNLTKGFAMLRRALERETES